MNEKSISVYQLSAALVLSRIFTFLLNIPVYKSPIPITNIVVNELISAVVGAAIIIPPILLSKNAEYSGSKALIKAENVIYIIAFTAFCAIMFFDSYRLFSGMVLEGAGVVFFAITIFACAVYAAKCGIEAIMRTGTVIAVIFAASFAFIIISSIGKINFTEFEATGLNIDYRLHDFLGSAEYVMFAVLIKKAKGSAKISGGIFLLVFFAVSFAAVVITACVLGNIAAYQAQPFFILSSVSGISIFTRLKSVHSIIFALLAAFKISMLFLCIRTCCENIVDCSKNKFKPTIFEYILMLAVAAVSSAACVFTDAIFAVSTVFDNIYTAAVFGGIIPLVRFISGKMIKEDK